MKKPQWGRYVRGEQLPGLDVLARIGNVSRRSVRWILTGDKEPAIEPAPMPAQLARARRQLDDLWLRTKGEGRDWLIIEAVLSQDPPTLARRSGIRQ